ncbi:MAG: hypothetical protein CME65_05820 [Halobacteriovoraceae bacterium]|nr:hypothetical protein [Halobacteriovoraceae bacterium]|tara:strand:- start:27282 stop:28229 length:948 start_codon:yes stop_codon:yes gene_type:complete
MKGILLLISLSLIGCDQLNNKRDNKDDNRDGSTVEAPQNPDNETPNLPTPAPIPEPIPEPTPEPVKPSCEVLCTNPLKQLPESNGFDYLSFPNFGYRGIGRCRGHALVMQRFSLLAKFDNSVSACDTSNEFCWLKIKSKIDRILSYQAATINGYSDLFEFSSDKRVRAYLWSIVAGTSHRYRAVDAKISVRRFENPHMNIFFELKKRVELGQLPYVGVVGAQTGSHALIVYSVENSRLRPYLCARDPNIVLGVAENCDHKIYFEDNRIYYQRYDRSPDALSFFRITSDEDQRVLRYKTALKARCMQTSREQRLCK